MIIKKIELLNFQVIKEFNADFEGNVYFITGDNELGKSTLLKAIGALLTGERDAVLRNGEEKGFAKMVIGDDGKEYEVKLSFSKANPRGTITITSEGMKSNNLSALQSIFGYTDFDAVEFSRWSETAEGRRKQIEVVKSLLPAEIRESIRKIDAEVAEIKEKRKDVNAQVKTCETICNQAEKLLEPGDTKKYKTKKDVTALMQEQAANAQLIEKAKTIRQKLAERTEQLAEIPERIKAENEDYEDAIFDNKTLIAQAEEEYKKELAEAKAKHDAEIERLVNESQRIENNHIAMLEKIEAEKLDFETRKQNAEKWLEKYEANNPEKTDIAEQLRQAEEYNRKCDLVADFDAKKEMLLDALEIKQKYEDALENNAEMRAKLIEKSKLPIEGLTFTEDGLELQGVPFVPGKVSDSQIMEVATKLIIASNPNVKVFRIARGESLGEKRLQAIIDIAKANGFQGFIEEVKRGQEELTIEEYTEKG